ncbi:MAG TPA: lysine--tRNA ligase [Candidatus Woesearchaeota archaeon]|nr:lysine--tRNA ligase [Candidatus Woesearchaeota archaeon]
MESLYWADQIAEKIISERGKKEGYVIASGITPSGVVHIGNFREEMTVELVKRALKDKGVEVRYIHSWDNYDRFRKVPANVPAEWAQYVGMPVSKVPDPWGCHGSYGEHFEKEFEDGAKELGVNPEYMNETVEYESCVYAEKIKTAMNSTEKIKEILNRFRKEDLGNSWYPATVYCPECGKDETKIIHYDGKYTVYYECNSCGKTNQINFSEEPGVKLRWRTDWAMRWAHHGVDFEPGGKDHSSPGGSRDTSSIICREIFDSFPPTYQVYNNISLKGTAGKMSGSKGNVVSLPELNSIYLPEVVRYMYASTRPKTDFSIPTDDEIFKVYEDFYTAERIYFNAAKEIDKKREAHWKRVYEMSVVEAIPDALPVQVPFKYMTYLSQFYADNDVIIQKLKESKHLGSCPSEYDLNRILKQIKCARSWAKKYADEEYKFSLQKEKVFEPDEVHLNAIHELIATIEKNFEENDLYLIAKTSGLGKEFFKMCYKILLNKDRGPKLLDLINMIGAEKVKEILELYC